MTANRRREWVAKGGEIGSLPAAEQAQMMKTLAVSNDDLTKAKPALRAGYDLLLAAVQRAQ